MLDFLFVGIGQCGNKFVDAFAYQKNKALAINTTQKDMYCLENINKQNLIEISAAGTKGGAGKTPALGEKAMKEHLDEVLQKIYDVGQESDYVFLWAGLGGGTGSGGLPVLLKRLIEDKKKKILVGLTLPDDSEGVEVQVNAFNSALKTLRIIDGNRIPYILIENNKIKNKMNMVNDFDWRSVNATISKIFSQFNKSANKNSPYSTFDETDFKKTLYMSGMMSLVKVVVDAKDITTENTLKDTIIEAWKKNNFFVDFDYTTARIITTVIEAPSKYLENKSNYKLLDTSLLKLRDACGAISPYTGVYPYNEKKENRNDKITVYCMLTGLKAPVEKLQQLQAKAKEEQEAMKEKSSHNAIDLSSFAALDDPFGEKESDDDLGGLDGLGAFGEKKDDPLGYL